MGVLGFENLRDRVNDLENSLQNQRRAQAMRWAFYAIAGVIVWKVFVK